MTIPKPDGAGPTEEVNLFSTMDANIWAKDFMRLYNKFGYEVDFETMRGWFASAIMNGYDHGVRKERAEAEKKIKVYREIAIIYHFYSVHSCDTFSNGDCVDQEAERLMKEETK